jgi:hypothetical protein
MIEQRIEENCSHHKTKAPKKYEQCGFGESHFKRGSLTKMLIKNMMPYQL